MTLLKRFLFYFAGFSIGLLLLFFFLGGKRASCDYGPNARVLKNIRTKQIGYTPLSLMQLDSNSLDTSVVSMLLKNGKVLFSDSKTKLDSCNLYVIKGDDDFENLSISVRNCENEATILSLDLRE